MWHCDKVRVVRDGLSAAIFVVSDLSLQRVHTASRGTIQDGTTFYLTFDILGVFSPLFSSSPLTLPARGSLSISPTSSYTNTKWRRFGWDR